MKKLCVWRMLRLWLAFDVCERKCVSENMRARLVCACDVRNVFVGCCCDYYISNNAYLRVDFVKNEKNEKNMCVANVNVMFASKRSAPWL